MFALREPPLFADCDGAELLARAGVEVVELPALAAEVRAVNAHLLGYRWRPHATPTGSTGRSPHATERAGPQWTDPLRKRKRYLLSSDAFFSTSSIPPARKNACSGRWS